MMRALLLMGWAVFAASLASVAQGSPAASHNGEWGRLFYSPAERRGEVGAQSPLPQEEVSRRYDGLIKREQPGAGQIHWVDGKPAKQRPPSQVRPGESWSTQGETRPEIRIKVERP